MAPLFRAVGSKYKSTDSDGVVFFEGSMDEEWATGLVPHGGYVLAQILEACVNFQALTHPDHPDLFHVVAHFLNRNSLGPFEVRVKRMRSGRTITNLTADLIQKGQINVSSHVIFGDLLARSEGRPYLTIEPPSPYARRLPIKHHPSNPSSFRGPKAWRYKFDRHMKISEDEDSYRRNEPRARATLFEEISSGPNGKLEKVGGGGVESARWLELVGNGSDRLRTSLLAFFVDMTKGFPEVIPTKGSGGWHPTMVLSMQFFHPLPPSSPSHASRTVGLYGTSSFLVDPFGRHDCDVEVWSAPCNVGDGEVLEGWRDRQVCLAKATQMAMTMPLALTRGKPRL